MVIVVLLEQYFGYKHYFDILIMSVVLIIIFGELIKQAIKKAFFITPTLGINLRDMF